MSAREIIKKSVPFPSLKVSEGYLKHWGWKIRFLFWMDGLAVGTQCWFLGVAWLEKRLCQEHVFWGIKVKLKSERRLSRGECVLACFIGCACREYPICNGKETSCITFAGQLLHMVSHTLSYRGTKKTFSQVLLWFAYQNCLEKTNSIFPEVRFTLVASNKIIKKKRTLKKTPGLHQIEPVCSLHDFTCHSDISTYLKQRWGRSHEKPLGKRKLATSDHAEWFEKRSEVITHFTRITPINQWLFLVPSIGGRYHIITQLAIYK